MTLVEGLISHPLIEDRVLRGADFSDHDLRSLHEVVCSAARSAAVRPEEYSAMPVDLADILETINGLVLQAARLLPTYR